MPSPEPSHEKHEKLSTLTGRIKTLLVHFYDPKTDQALEEAALDDWLAILGKLPFHWVDVACREYLSAPRRSGSGAPVRPVPGDIKDRANKLAYDAEQRKRQKEMLSLPPPPPPEPKAKNPQLVAEALAAMGFAPRRIDKVQP